MSRSYDIQAEGEARDSAFCWLATERGKPEGPQNVERDILHSPAALEAGRKA